LTQQPLGAAIGVGDSRQFSGEQAMEIVDGRQIAAKLVVEPEDLHDQAGAQLEGGRRTCRSRGFGCQTQEDLALERREQWRRVADRPA
jgi:hypothetical protein